MAVFVWLLHNTAKEIGERKGYPPPRASPTPCYSSIKASAELATLKQSSTTTPSLIALLGVAQGDLFSAKYFLLDATFFTLQLNFICNQIYKGTKTMANRIKKVCRKNSDFKGRKMFQKIKEKYMSFFNNLCLWIGKQVFWYAIFELLNQLFHHLF